MQPNIGFLTCQICENRVISEKFQAHNEICIKVTKLKDQIGEERHLIQAELEKAHSWKQSIQNHLNIQKAIMKRNNSGRNDTCGNLSSIEDDPGTPQKLISNATKKKKFTFKKFGTATDVITSLSDTEANPTKSLVNLQNDDEYKKMMVEFQNSQFAFKKLAHYEEKIMSTAYNIYKIDEADVFLKNDLAIIIGEIRDEQLAKYLKDLASSIEKMCELKKQYEVLHDELEEISASANPQEQNDQNTRKKFQSKKSLSFKKQRTLNFNPKKKAQFQEDQAYGTESTPKIPKTSVMSLQPIREDSCMSRGEDADDKLSSGSRESETTETPASKGSGSEKTGLPKFSMFSKFQNSPTFSPSAEKRNVLRAKVQGPSSMTSKFAGIFKSAPSKKSSDTTNDNQSQVESSADNCDEIVLGGAKNNKTKSMFSKFSLLKKAEGADQQSGDSASPKKEPGSGNGSPVKRRISNGFKLPDANKDKLGEESQPNIFDIRKKLSANTGKESKFNATRQIQDMQLNNLSQKLQSPAIKPITKRLKNDLQIGAITKSSSEKRESNVEPANQEVDRGRIVKKSNLLMQLAGVVDTNSSGNATKKRTASNDRFKALHKEELKGFGGFAHIKERDRDRDDTNTPKKEDAKKCDFDDSSDDNRSSDFMPSPTMRAYYSDSGVRPRTRKLSNDNERNGNQVSLEDFEYLKKIGQGAYGIVWLVRKKKTKVLYAMKIVDSEDQGASQRLTALKAEKEIFETIQGDFVVRCVWSFSHEKSIIFVMEYMLGGDFLSVLEKMGRFDDHVAKFYFAELCLAVHSLHKLNIVHRDLKPDNLLLDAQGHIKLTDFGLSEKGLEQYKKGNTPKQTGRRSSIINKPNVTEDPIEKQSNSKQDEFKIEFKVKTNHSQRESIFGSLLQDKQTSFLQLPTSKEEIKDDKPMRTSLQKKRQSMMRQPSEGESGEKKHRIIGTPDYIAPEVINGEDCSGKAIDWWSMGCILYEFLVGIPPFNDNSVDDIFDNIRNHRMEWPDIGDGEDEMLPEAADLIKRLLEPDPKKRIGSKRGLEEIKEHEYFKGFNWNVRSQKAEIIPFIKDETDTSNFERSSNPTDTIEANPLQQFGNISGNKSSGNNSFQRRPGTASTIRSETFTMRRLDVLYEKNIEMLKKQSDKQDDTLK